jgi:hypothetical protein
VDRKKVVKLVLIVLAAGAAAAAASGLLPAEVSSLLTAVATALGAS